MVWTAKQSSGIGVGINNFEIDVTFEYGRNISGQIFTHWNDTISSEIADVVYTKNEYAYNKSVADTHDYTPDTTAPEITPVTGITIEN